MGRARHCAADSCGRRAGKDLLQRLARDGGLHLAAFMNIIRPGTVDVRALNTHVRPAAAAASRRGSVTGASARVSQPRSAVEVSQNANLVLGAAQSLGVGTREFARAAPLSAHRAGDCDCTSASARVLTVCWSPRGALLVAGPGRGASSST